MLTSLKYIALADVDPKRPKSAQLSELPRRPAKVWAQATPMGLWVIPDGTQSAIRVTTYNGVWWETE